MQCTMCICKDKMITLCQPMFAQLEKGVVEKDQFLSIVKCEYPFFRIKV